MVNKVVKNKAFSKGSALLTTPISVGTLSLKLLFSEAC